MPRPMELKLDIQRTRALLLSYPNCPCYILLLAGRFGLPWECLLKSEFSRGRMKLNILQYSFKKNTFVFKITKTAFHGLKSVIIFNRMTSTIKSGVMKDEVLKQEHSFVESFKCSLHNGKRVPWYSQQLLGACSSSQYWAAEELLVADISTKIDTRNLTALRHWTALVSKSLIKSS